MGWLVGWLVDWLIGWLVGWLGWFGLVRFDLVWFGLVWLGGCLLSCLFACSLVCFVGAQNYRCAPQTYLTLNATS